MMRRSSYRIIIAVACCGLLVAVGLWHEAHTLQCMRGAVEQALEMNRNFVPFTSDSTMRRVVTYFDHPLRFWVSANDRLRAHYALGCVYRDMHEAPLAIAEYQEAISHASKNKNTVDSTELYTQRAVYGQMADLFHSQNLPEDELLALKEYNRYSWLMGDTMEAIDGIRRLERPYYLLNQYDSAIFFERYARELFKSRKDTINAARTFITSAFIHVQQGDYKRAGLEIDTLRREADLFDQDGTLLPGRETLYITLGGYYCGINALDSAKYYFHQALASELYEGAYWGLLQVYEKERNPDSMAKYSRLYSDANDAMHRQMNSDAVHRISASYNYGRALKQLSQSEAKSSLHFHLFLFLCVCVIALTTLFLVRFRMHKRQHELRLRSLSDNYTNALSAYETSLRELQAVEENHERFVKWKQWEVDTLSKKKENAERLFRQLRDVEKERAYYSNAKIRALQAAMGKAMMQPLEEKEWQTLLELFHNSFPTFVSYVKTKGDLSTNEWRIIILMDLQINPGDMSSLIGISSARVSQLKSQICNKLFQKDVSRLALFLKQTIHPLIKVDN